MKRYMLFAFLDYYPEGGMNDYVTSFDEVPSDELTERIILEHDRCGYWHILDLQTMTIVAASQPHELEKKFNA